MCEPTVQYCVSSCESVAISISSYYIYSLGYFLMCCNLLDVASSIISMISEVGD
jgi:hypothetical protein